MSELDSKRSGAERNEIEVWLAEPPRKADERWRKERLKLLSAGERIRHDAFHFEEDRDLYLTAHALLRRTLARHTGIPAALLRFEHDAFGKPRLAGEAAGLSFNLSHTRGLSACLVAGSRPCGIDLERVVPREGLLDIAHKHFTSDEVTQLQSLPERKRLDAFYTLWTLKEALLKAHGFGLRLPLNAFGFKVPRSEEEPVSLAQYDYNDGDGDNWEFRSLSPLPGYRMAVAFENRDGMPPPLRIQRLGA